MQYIFRCGIFIAKQYIVGLHLVTETSYKYGCIVYYYININLGRVQQVQIGSQSSGKPKAEF